MRAFYCHVIKDKYFKLTEKALSYELNDRGPFPADKI